MGEGFEITGTNSRARTALHRLVCFSLAEISRGSGDIADARKIRRGQILSLNNQRPGENRADGERARGKKCCKDGCPCMSA